MIDSDDRIIENHSNFSSAMVLAAGGAVMKKMLFLFICVLTMTQIVRAQNSGYYVPPQGSSSGFYSSWYDPSSNVETYECTFGDGSSFKGNVWKKNGVIDHYEGTLTSLDGNVESGKWNQSWCPVSNHNLYRAYDRTYWTVEYDNSGNRVRSTQQNPPSAAPSSGIHSVNTPGSASNPCRVCNQTGKCSTCNGTGISPNHAPGRIVSCGACGGTGRCSTCHGSGYHN